jgi:hypothetical protein
MLELARSGAHSVGSTAGTLAAAVSVALNGGLAVALVNARAARSSRGREALRTDVHGAQDALRELRAGYRLRARHDAAAPDDNALADREDAFDMAAQRVLVAEVVTRATAYVEVGRLYAVRDPDHGEGAEATAYRDVTAALLAVLKRTR